MSEYETSRGDRRITFRFDCGTDEVTGEQRVVDVTARHDRERRRYVAHWNPKVVEPSRHGWHVERFEVFSGGTLLSEPCARFSQHGLEEFAQRALAAYVQPLED